LKQALEIAEVFNNIFLRIITANVLASCYLHQAHWQAALDVLEANEAFIIDHHFNRAPFPNAMLQNGLAAAYLFAAEQSDSRERIAWQKKAVRACLAALKWSKVLRPTKPEAQRLQGRHEWLKGHTVQAQRWWQKSLAEAEALGMPYEVGLTHLEIGQRLRDNDHLEKAKAIFVQIGAERDLAKGSVYWKLGSYSSGSKKRKW
jgi:hypothetical protein